MTAVADPERLLSSLRELARLTGDEHGAQRVAWTPMWARARAWERELLAELPVEVEVDEAGNLWATLPGRSSDCLLIGSHIDSVPNGGWLDGCLGVVAGVEVLRSIAADGVPALTIKLVDWADEEGARFGLSLLGSSAAAGTLDTELLRDLRDVEGIGASEALAAHRVDVDQMKRSGSRLNGAVCYLELHIEQGPVLETIGMPLAVVTGTVGTERWSATFTGQSAHAGTTPMRRRQDALSAAARLALSVREIARSLGGVGTVGRIDAEPGIPTAVAGVATAVVDQRHVDATTLGEIHARTESASRVIADEEGVAVTWSPLARIAPVSFDAALAESAAACIRELQEQDVRLPSGALHDAVSVATIGIPTVMLFVRSERGLSHTREENTAEADLVLALSALESLARTSLGRSPTALGHRPTRRTRQ